MEPGWQTGMRNPMNFPNARHMFPPPQYHSGFPPPWAGTLPGPWQMPNYNGNGYTRKNNTRQRKEPVFIDFCDVCDRGFKNIAKKEEHFRQHVKCDEHGCNFEAHFKIVSIHKQNLHRPGLKIKLDTPEDIKKWRNDRKRKYPTCENVKLKMKLANERNENGNVLQNKNFGRMRQWKNRKNFNKPNTNSKQKSTNLGNIDASRKSESLNLLESNDHALIEDNVSSDESDSDTKVNVVKANISLGLCSLMQSYASDSEDEVTPKAIKKSEDSSIQNNDIKESSKENVSSTQETLNGGGSICDVPTETEIPSEHHHITGLSGKKKKNCVHVHKKKATLLEMLLAPDIRRERNHILQCVRFVVKNNFFDGEITC